MSDQRRDEELLRQLGAALEAADPVPPEVLAAAKASFTWRTVDAELAALVFDSAGDELVGVRRAGVARQITFRGSGVEIEVQMVAKPARRLIGQLVPPQPAIIELHHATGPRTAQADSLGRFSFDDVPGGFVKLTCRLQGQDAPVHTEWAIL